MCVHDALSCWKTDNKIDNNFKELIKEYVRCAFNWQNVKKWKRNHVLMQDRTKSTENIKKTLQEKLFDKLLFIISIVNFERSISQTNARKKKKYKKYIEILIKLLRFKTKKVFHEVHDMIEVDSYLFKKSKIQRQLKSRRIFKMINILKNVHIVFDFMISDKHNFISYINNYVDWNSYNILYDMNFMKKSKKIKNKFLKKQ